MENRISLLHLTDLHFESNPRTYAVIDWLDMCLRGRKASYDSENSELLAQWTWENRSNYHAILITGDVANTGHKKDLKTAFKYIDPKNITQSDMPWLSVDGFPSIINSSKNIYLLPGNHDKFNHLNRKPNCKKFNKIFEKYWSCSKHVRGKNSTIVLPGNDEIGLSIVSADFSLEDYRHSEEGVMKLVSRRNFGYYGQGKAYDSRVEALVEATKKIRVKFPNYPVIWAIHYELQTKKSSMKLIDESSLLKAISENNIECVVNGHTHNNNKKIINGTCTAITSASPFANSIFHKNSFSLIDFYIDGNKIKDIIVNPICYRDYEYQPWEFTR